MLEAGEYDSNFVSNYVDVFIRDALKRVPGVADVQVFGAGRYSMRVWLDPNRLAARADGGRRGGRAARAERKRRGGNGRRCAGASGTDLSDQRSRGGRLREQNEFENVIVKSAPDGTLVRLGDVAAVELGAESYSSLLRFQGIEGVGFGVLALPTANALEIKQGSPRR